MSRNPAIDPVRASALRPSDREVPMATMVIAVVASGISGAVAGRPGPTGGAPEVRCMTLSVRFETTYRNTDFNVRSNSLWKGSMCTERVIACVVLHQGRGTGRRQAVGHFRIQRGKPLIANRNQ